MKKVMIPTCKRPFNVFVNGVKYTYPSGTEQEVPDEVAIVIEQHEAYHEEKDKIDREGDGSQGGGTGGGASTCKLKLEVKNSEEMGFYVYGHAYIPGYEDIDLECSSGTTEYEIPCGSIIFAYASNSYPSSRKNVTVVCEEEPLFAFRVTAEAGGEAIIGIEAYC